MEDFVIPSNFPHVVTSVKAAASYNEESHTLRIPSLALKLGHSLQKISSIVECKSMIDGNDSMAESARNFKRIYETIWN